YFGYLKYPEAIYMYEILADPKILSFTKNVMEQSAAILRKVYPDEFTALDLSQHINNLLSRFQNKNLRDTLFRVGSDLHRKLGKDDRFMGIIRLAEEVNLSFDNILEALSMGILFQGTDEQCMLYPGDKLFHQKWLKDRGAVLQEVCGLDQENDSELIWQIYQNLDNSAAGK
ncbi:MAG: hypothetical protein DRJ29_16530, partial [Bacteroidetes bacterium]